MKKDCFHTPTHTSSPPKLATTHANTHRSTPRCPGLPQLVEWGHSLGKALSSLHLVVSVIYSECYVARDSWQEVRAGPQSRTRVLTWQKRPKDTSAVLFSFIDVTYTRTLCPPCPLLWTPQCFSVNWEHVLRCTTAERILKARKLGTLVLSLKSGSTWESDPCTAPSGVRWKEAGSRRGWLLKTAASLLDADAAVPPWAWQSGQETGRERAKVSAHIRRI